MPDEKFNMSRRQTIAALGTIGAASAGAGLGTSALFNDTETFENNQLTAGELDLIVDYATYTDQGSYNESSQQGTVNGSADEARYSYVVDDVKPGDSGRLVFCPKIVDNPAWLWVGSTGLTDYENGQTEPEAEVDGTGGNPGAGNGELSDAVEVTVTYASGVTVSDTDSDGVDEVTCDSPKRQLNNGPNYTLRDLADDLMQGWAIDGDGDIGASGTPEIDPYPASSDSETQNGPCICIDWEVPLAHGNDIQTDSLEMDFVFSAVQQRHNDTNTNPFGNTAGNS